MFGQWIQHVADSGNRDVLTCGTSTATVRWYIRKVSTMPSDDWSSRRRVFPAALAASKAPP